MAIFFNLKVVTGIVISGEFRVHKSNRGCKTHGIEKNTRTARRHCKQLNVALCVLQISSAQWVRSQKWECDCEWSRKVLQISYSSSCSSSSFFLSFFLSHSCSSIFLLLSSDDRWIDSPNDAFEVRQPSSVSQYSEYCDRTCLRFLCLLCTAVRKIKLLLKQKKNLPRF